MDDPAPVMTRHKLNVDDFYRMAEVGILGERDRVELIEGELIDMAPIGADHAFSVGELTHLLVLACNGRALVRVQCPVRLDPHNEPQPDFAVLRLREDHYRGAHPSASDVLALIEVANSSLRFDTNVKRPLYARFGIAEYWIVNRERKVVMVYRKPVGDEYAWSKEFGPEECVALALAPEIEIALARVLG